MCNVFLLTAMHPQNKMMTDCLDIRDEGFIKEIQAQLNDIQIRFPDKNDVPNQEGLFHFVRHFVSKIDYIELNRESRWSTDELRRLFQVIKASTVKVCQFILFSINYCINNANSVFIANALGKVGRFILYCNIQQTVNKSHFQ